MNDVLGQAIWDYYNNTTGNAKLWIYNTYGPKEEMPVETYFRTEAEMPELEIKALNECRGKVLDIGAGAGGHALALQEKGVDVTAIDISAKATEVMLQRGVNKVIQQDIFAYNKQEYSTLLLLMNGIGLTASIQGLHFFLQHAKQLLLPGGQLIFDSSDVAYLYNSGLPNEGNYYGEIQYEYRYKRKTSGWFTWLYIDEETLTMIAREEGWQINIIFKDAFGQYLARLY